MQTLASDCLLIFILFVVKKNGHNRPQFWSLMMVGFAWNVIKDEKAGGLCGRRSVDVDETGIQECEN